jgi:hypothetical protein
MKVSFFIVLMLSILGLAKSPAIHREHSAHEHGAGKLAIAFDNARGQIEFKAAAEGILGFEHKARTDKDKKKVAEAIEHFDKNISQMIVFESSLNCHFLREMIGQIPEEGKEGSGEHSDWAANFQVSCDRSPLGSGLKIDLSSFKLLNDIDVTVLVGDIQKSAEFKKDPVQIVLKP